MMRLLTRTGLNSIQLRLSTVTTTKRNEATHSLVSPRWTTLPRMISHVPWLTGEKRDITYMWSDSFLRLWHINPFLSFLSSCHSQPVLRMIICIFFSTDTGRLRGSHLICNYAAKTPLSLPTLTASCWLAWRPNGRNYGAKHYNLQHDYASARLDWSFCQASNAGPSSKSWHRWWYVVHYQKKTWISTLKKRLFLSPLRYKLGMSSFYIIGDLFGLADCAYRFLPSCYALLLCGVSSPVSHVIHFQALTH